MTTFLAPVVGGLGKLLLWFAAELPLAFFDFEAHKVSLPEGDKILWRTT